MQYDVDLVYDDWSGIIREQMYNEVPYGPGHAKMCIMPYANNKGADQPAHPRSLINNFVSMIYILALSKVSRF